MSVRATVDTPQGSARWVWGLFAVGLFWSTVMALRAQFELDQYVLAVRGWMLVREGWLVPFGALTSAGGFQPGALTSLLMGLPLLIWEDYRAIGLLTLLTHVIAYLLLDSTLKDVVGPRGRVVLCVVYWLNPWRLYYSAHIWNPNLVFLPAAIHLVTAFRSRHRASPVHSFLHVLSVGLAFHLHASFLILAAASALLFARGLLKVHWWGFVAGVVAVVASASSWLTVALQYPGILPLNRGTIGYGLIKVAPVLEAAVYWLRYPTAAVSSKMTRFDFGPALGETWDVILSPLSSAIAWVIGPLTLLLSLAANVWLWRRSWRSVFTRQPGRSSSLDWLLRYSCWIFLALLLVIALTPADVSGPSSQAGMTSWRGFIVLHAAALPLVIWSSLLWRTAAAKRVRAGVVCSAVALVLMIGAMTIAGPMYRKGGENHLSSVLGEHHEMLDALGIYEGATIVIDPEAGFSSELLDGPESLERPPPFPRM